MSPSRSFSQQYVKTGIPCKHRHYPPDSHPVRRIDDDLTLAVVLLAVGAHARGRQDAWVGQTVLPAVLSEVDAEMRAQDGILLRAFALENGRMRLAVRLDQVDPQFIEMLIAYEDKRFHDHSDIDLNALIRVGDKQSGMANSCLVL